LYQCITGEISIYINDKNIQSAYAADDLMQEHNIVHQNSPAQSEALLHFKALLQSYYNHVTAKYYLVKERK